MRTTSWAARKRVALLGVLTLVSAGLVTVVTATPAAADPCAPVVNPVACENSKPGVDPAVWDVSGAGSSSIQGFSTDISANVGETVRLKIDTDARSYRVDVYRLGFYGGRGARAIASVTPSVTLPQSQPNCLTQSSTGLVDCGNWGVSASWTIPAGTVSGVFVAKLVRTDGTAGSSHIPFVVRDDASRSDLLLQTADTTWQAYNRYGGNSLYVGSPAGRAYKVSYNRPITTRGTSPEDGLFSAEYPMIRFLEANGYDVSYTSGIDTDRRGALLRNHKTFVSVGHDEYWSGAQRANVEAARDAGVNLAFFSGNEVFWKTRYESSIAPSGESYRTLVCYKETKDAAKIDPSPAWTGTWRDPRFSPPSDAGRPENALTGTIFMVNGGTSRRDSIRIPEADGKMRFWRGTAVATQSPGATATMPAGTLGYEWDAELDNGSRPAGLVRLSTATYTISGDLLLDHGNTYGSGSATHALTLYRAPSGALVFGAGTVQWSWGLDATHDLAGTAINASMRQATVNLLADMGAQPATLVSGLTQATASTDSTAPTSVITAPAAGSSLTPGSAVTIRGTATDSGGGRVGGVEVSLDGGASWRRAEGRESWTYSWTPTSSSAVTLRSRAADDSGNLETPSAGVAVGGGDPAPVTCPCTVFGNAVPAVAADPETAAVELGMRFRASRDGVVTGVRFFKGTGNSGTHTGSLWTNTGTRLATGTFSAESASGWQSMSFASPVAVAAGTTYVVSYYAPVGRYAVNTSFFASSGVTAGPLTALRDGTDGANGVYRYGTGGGFPSSTWQSANYWVDVTFADGPTGGTPDTTAPTVTGRSPAAGATGVSTGTAVTATFSEPVQPATVSLSLTGPSGAVPATVAVDAAGTTVTLTPSAPLAAGAAHTAALSGAKDAAGNTMAPVSWSFTTAAAPPPPPPPATCPCTVFGDAVPAIASDPDTTAVELGMRFQASRDGVVTGVRFYKGTGSTGTHTGSLWTNTGTQLATGTFSAETASGWQSMSFPSAVPVTAGQTYVVSYYAPVGRYAKNAGFFASSASTAGPLTALRDGTDGANGVYRYGFGGGFPTATWESTNYWVDVTFADGPTGGTPDTTAPTVTGRSPAPGATGVSTGTAVAATFSEAVQPSTVVFALTGPSGAVPATVALDAAGTTATLTPTAPLAAGAVHTAALSGARDAAGNEMAAVNWSFTTAGSPPPPPPPPPPPDDCPCTVFGNDVPAVAADPDTKAVELGMRFRASRDGVVTGVRFYKGTGNTGTHTGSLWTNTGSRLATVTFAGESASGWQVMSFASPVSVTAGTTYVVSYYAPVGRYAKSVDFFGSTGLTNGPLTALRNGTDGGNGVYRYGAGGGFPTRTWKSSNYWVDVVFR